jgi:hypothetical protein
MDDCVRVVQIPLVEAVDDLERRTEAGQPEAPAIFWANLDMEGHPHPLTLHAGLPPTSGEKRILSQWIRDRVAPQRPND